MTEHEKNPAADQDIVTVPAFLPGAGAATDSETAKDASTAPADTNQDDEAAKAPAKKTSKKGKGGNAGEPVVFRTKRNDDGANFKFMNVRPIRNPEHPGHYEWHIPAELAERAMRHHHVVTGRVVKV